MGVKITPAQKFGVIQIFCQILQQDRDERVRARSAESLGKLKDARAISVLSQTALADSSPQVRIAAIEALFLICNEDLRLMPEQPKDRPIFHIGQVGNLNAGDVEIKGDQIGIQNNYSSDPEVRGALSELQTALADLQTKHPDITTTQSALSAIDVEFTEMKRDEKNQLVQLRKFMLDPKRHAQAIKATIAEIGKHYLEDSVFAKAIVTYLENLID